MRRFIAIVLMLLLPIQSAWALVAMPCRGHVSLQDKAAVMAMAAAHEAHASHHEAMAGHDGHHAGHGDAHEHHDAAPPAGHDPGNGGLASAGQDPCSGSAACMSLHSPPLAAGFDTGLPALKLPSQLSPAEGARFSSVPPQRLQRPPIGLAA